MPRHENPEVVGAVMALDHVGVSQQQISNILKERNVSITKMGVHLLIARKKLDASGKKKTVTRLTNPGTPKVRKGALIAKVKKAVTRKNPKTQRIVARNLKVSVSTVNRVIHQDLHANLEKKVSSSRPFEQADQATSRARSAVPAVFGEGRIQENNQWG